MTVDSPDPDSMSDAQGALAAALRTQIMDRVPAQEQLVVASAAIGGAAASFGSDFLDTHSEVVAFLAALFATLLLAMLRQDEEITNIAAHLEDESAFGPHATVQRSWERHKFLAMQESGQGRTLFPHFSVAISPPTARTLGRSAAIAPRARP